MAKRKVLNSQVREMIARVYDFMKSEAENGVWRLTDARGRTARATGVSESTVSRAIKEGKHARTSSKSTKQSADSDLSSGKAGISPGNDQFDLQESLLIAVGEVKNSARIIDDVPGNSSSTCTPPPKKRKCETVVDQYNDLEESSDLKKEELDVELDNKIDIAEHMVQIRCKMSPTAIKTETDECFDEYIIS